MPDYTKDGDTVKVVMAVPTWTISEFEAELSSNKYRLELAKNRLMEIPVKTKPDAETLEFWNRQHDEWRRSVQDEINILETLITKQETVLKTELVKK